MKKIFMVVMCSMTKENFELITEESHRTAESVRNSYNNSNFDAYDKAVEKSADTVRTYFNSFAIRRRKLLQDGKAINWKNETVKFRENETAKFEWVRKKTKKTNEWAKIFLHDKNSEYLRTYNFDSVELAFEIAKDITNKEQRKCCLLSFDKDGRTGSCWV